MKAQAARGSINRILSSLSALQTQPPQPITVQTSTSGPPLQYAPEAASFAAAPAQTAAVLTDAEAKQQLAWASAHLAQVEHQLLQSPFQLSYCSFRPQTVSGYVLHVSCYSQLFSCHKLFISTGKQCQAVSCMSAAAANFLAVYHIVRVDCTQVPSHVLHVNCCSHLFSCHIVHFDRKQCQAMSCMSAAAFNFLAVTHCSF